MKKTLILSLVLILALGVTFVSCNKKSDEKVKADATQVVNDFKKLVDDYSKWTNTADMADPMVMKMVEDWTAKLAMGSKKYNDNVEAYKKGLTPEDMTALDTEMKKANDLVAKAKEAFAKKAQEAAAKAQAAPAPEAAAPAAPVKK